MLRNFVRSVDDLYGPMQSSVVINDKIDDGFDLGLCTDANCLGYSDNAINETVGVLQENLSQNGQGWSWIFSGRNNGELLGRLSGKFFAQQGRGFVPLDERGSIAADKLRLDNNVVFYAADTKLDRVNLSETYAVNKGPLIEKPLGFWSHQEGLIITQDRIWERRSDLQGVQLKNLVKR